MAQYTDEQLQRKIQEGFIVESEADMTETYKKALIGQLTVQGDTELISAPAYYMAARDAPSTNTMVSATPTSPIVFSRISASTPTTCCTTGPPRSLRTRSVSISRSRTGPSS